MFCFSFQWVPIILRQSQVSQHALSHLPISSLYTLCFKVSHCFSQFFPDIISCPPPTLFFVWSVFPPRILLFLSFPWLTLTYCLRFSFVSSPFSIPIILLACFLSLLCLIVSSLSMFLSQLRMNDSSVQILFFKLFSLGVSM